MTSTTPRHRLRVLGAALALALLATACGAADPGDGEAARPFEPIAVQDDQGQRRPEYTSSLPVEPEIELAEGLGFTPTSEAVVTTNPDGTTSVIGTVEVPTAGGPVEIEGADLIIEQDPETGEATIIGGIGQVPFPTVGELGDAVINHLPQGIIGRAKGRDLHHLGAHLVDEREYLYFHFDGGLDIDLPIGGRPGYEAIPSTIVVPTGKSATMVLDPSDPYFYIGGACPQDVADDGPERNPEDRRDDDREPSDDRATATTQPSDPTGGGYTIDAANLPPGEDCGFGFSLEGNIPAPAVAGGSTFSGHVVLDGIVPLYTGVELDGSALLAIDQGVRTLGWGDVLATLPLIPDWLNIQIPLGNGAVDVQADGARVGLAMEGIVGGPEEITLPLDIPITLPSNSNVSFVASYGFLVNADGTLTLDPASQAELGGEMGMGLASFGELIGLDLEDMVASESLLRLDQTGAHLRGNMRAQIHPVLESDATVAMEAFLAFDDPAASFLTYDADLRIAGTDLAGATIDLDRTGLFVRGLVATEGLEIEVAGQVTDSGADLTGRTAVEIPLDGLAELAQATSTALTDAIADVERIDDSIDDMRETVRAERRDRDRGFVAAQAALRTAQTDLDVIDDNIAINDRKIADLRARHRAEVARYARLNAADQALQWITHNATLTGWDAEIAALVTANGAQRGYRPAAQASLRAAEETLADIQAVLDAAPVDADPRILTLLASRDAAMATLESTRAGADLLDAGGLLIGEIVVTVGTGGLGGSFDGRLCQSDGTDCSNLAGGRVIYFPRPELCIELVGLGDQCLPIV